MPSCFGLALKDFSLQPPAQELIARDLHDVEWKFRHIFRGNSCNIAFNCRNKCLRFYLLMIFNFSSTFSLISSSTNSFVVWVKHSVLVGI